MKAFFSGHYYKYKPFQNPVAAGITVDQPRVEIRG
jgi:hypothetical protein